MRFRGVTFIELLLLTLLIGLLASVIGPYLSSTRGESAAQEIRAEIQSLLVAMERYATQNQGRWPRNLTTLAEALLYQPSEDVDLCLFEPRPGSRNRAPYVLIYAAKPDTRLVLFTAYPSWGGRILEYRPEEPGCAGFRPPAEP